MLTSFLEKIKMRVLIGFAVLLMPHISFGQCQVQANTDTASACTGDTVFLSATGATNFTWSGMSSLSCTNCTSPYAIVGNSSDTIIVEGTSSVNMPAVNGDFTNGNTGFSTQYTYNATSIWNEGTYAVGTNPNAVHPNFGTWGDHTTGTGRYMLVNGATTGNRVLWRQNVNFPPNTTVVMSWWMLTFATPPGSVILRVDGQNVGNAVSTPPSTGVWQRVQFSFTTANSTAATVIQIITVSSLVAGNDFGLDDIGFTYNCTSYDTIYVEQNAKALIQTELNTASEGCDQVCAKWTNSSSLDSTQATYVWNYGDGSPLDTVFSGEHCYQKEGTYYVKLYAQSNTGCPDSTWLDTIVVAETPVVGEISLSGEGMTVNGGLFVQPSTSPEVSLNLVLNSPVEVQGYVIDWGDGNVETANNVGQIQSIISSHVYTQYDPVQICVKVIGELGCFDELCTRLVFTPLVVVPNVFSPNSDGVNDSYVPDFRAAERVEWKVFNRWGKVVFESFTLGEEWDGTTGGHAVPEGTYYIVAQAWGAGGGEPYSVHGSITLMK